MAMAYSSLDPHHIRVLTLEQSDQHDSIISCSLAAVPLSENMDTQYEALSYVWGDHAEGHDILLNGQPASITRNLWTALTYIRKKDASRTLWIDAICINQDDMQERNEQVRQMGQIYSQASQVLIWLGPPDAEIENTMSALAVPGALKGKLYEDFPKDIALGLQRILSQPWWHRIWVIQEHVLATADPIVGCGTTWLSWTQLSEALLDYSRSKIDESGTTITDDSSTWVMDAFTLLRHVLLRKQWNDPSYLSDERAPIAEIVERTRGYQATDKRDQVFAIWDLLRGEDKEHFPAPDYARSASELYQEATLAFLRSKKNLAFLMHAVDKDAEELGLPSWCVDFSKKMWDWGGYGNFAGGHDFTEHEESEESQRYMSVLSHDVSLGTLQVLGGVLGQVVMSRPLVPPSTWRHSQTTVMIDGQRRPVMGTKIGDYWVFSQFAKEVLRMSLYWCKIWEARHGIQVAKERLAAGKVWRTAFGGGILFNIVDAVCVRRGIETIDGDDRPREFWVVEAFVRMNSPGYADSIKEMGFFLPTPELSDSQRLNTALWETLLLMAHVNRNKWWFTTDTGYVGRTEHEVVTGDRLCTISGCRAPLILRPHDGNGGLLKLITMPHSQDFLEDDHRTREHEVEREILTLR